MNLEIRDRYENQDPDTALANSNVSQQGDDGRLPLDNPGRHRHEDEDCTKGKSTFTNRGHRLEQ